MSARDIVMLSTPRGLQLPSFKVEWFMFTLGVQRVKSNASTVIGRFTEVYSLHSSLCLDRCTLYHKYHGCCQYYCENSLAVDSFRPFASR